MKVTMGISEELEHNSWFKHDVELDDSDLEALFYLFEKSLPENLTPAQKYGILSSEAERLVTVGYAKKLNSVNRPTDALMDRVGILKEQMLDKILQLGV